MRTLSLDGTIRSHACGASGVYLACRQRESLAGRRPAVFGEKRTEAIMEACSTLR
jgi:hypothetical protein